MVTLRIERLPTAGYFLCCLLLTVINLAVGVMVWETGINSDFERLVPFLLGQTTPGTSQALLLFLYDVLVLLHIDTNYSVDLCLNSVFYM